jgi:chromate transporter
MAILIQLFVIFGNLSLFSFGGGFVMLTAAMKAVESNHWATANQLTDTIAIATMSPGPVGVNLAVSLGYKIDGLMGALAAFVGIVLPTTILVILVAMFLFKIYKHPLVKAAFYGLRPVITGIIIYAAVSLLLKNHMIFAASHDFINHGVNLIIQGVQLIEVKSILLAAAVFVVLLKTKIPPIFLIFASGVIGIVLFSGIFAFL